MSVRPSEPVYIRINSDNAETMISTDWRQPSVLPVCVLKGVGLPDRDGLIHLTRPRVTLHVTFGQPPSDDVVTVWASWRTVHQCEEPGDSDCAIL